MIRCFGFWKFKRIFYSILSWSSLEKSDSNSGLADVLAGICIWFAFAVLCLKFPSPSYQVPSSSINSPPCSIPWSLHIRVIHFAFLQYSLHISICALVTLYYSYLFICLSSFPDCELTKISDFTFHLYVIKVESAWHRVGASQILMELIRNNRLGS